MGSNTIRRSCLCTLGCVPYFLDGGFNSYFLVPDSMILPAQDGNGNYLFFGPGVHRHHNPFLTTESPISLLQKDLYIKHGNRTIVTVPQGNLGLCTDRGQPVLLPPGLHQWISNTMVFERLLDLSNHVIEMGPYTLLTVDEG